MTLRAGWQSQALLFLGAYLAAGVAVTGLGYVAAELPARSAVTLHPPGRAHGYGCC